MKSAIARAKPRIGVFFWDYGMYSNSVSGGKNAANGLAKGFLLNEYSPPKKYADDAVDVKM